MGQLLKCWWRCYCGMRFLANHVWSAVVFLLKRIAGWNTWLYWRVLNSLECVWRFEQVIHAWSSLNSLIILKRIDNVFLLIIKWKLFFWIGFWVIEFMLVIWVKLIKSKVFKIWKGNHHNSNIIQSTFCYWSFQNKINDFSTLFVTICCFVIIDWEPCTIYAFPVWKFIKYSITTQKNEIMVFLNFEGLDVWYSNNYIWISTILLVLCLDVSKSPWDWKSTWKYSVRTHQVRTLNSNSSKWGNLRHSLCLINFATILLNSHLLKFIIRSMVSWQGIYFIPSLGTHNRSWITNISNIGHLINNQTTDCTRSTFIKIINCSISLTLIVLIYHIQKHLLCFCKSISQRIFRILRKLLISNDQLVKIVS